MAASSGNICTGISPSVQRRCTGSGVLQLAAPSSIYLPPPHSCLSLPLPFTSKLPLSLPLCGAGEKRGWEETNVTLSPSYCWGRGTMGNGKERNSIRPAPWPPKEKRKRKGEAKLATVCLQLSLSTVIKCLPTTGASCTGKKARLVPKVSCPASFTSRTIPFPPNSEKGPKGPSFRPHFHPLSPYFPPQIALT